MNTPFEKQPDMKRRLMFAVVLLIALSARAQKTPAVKEKDRSNDPALFSAIESLRTAMISGNRDSLAAIVSDQLSYGHSGGKVEDKAAFVESIASGHSDFVTIDLADQTIVTSGKVAIVRHTFVAGTNDNNKPGNVRLKVMLVWQKEHGSWILLARQAVHVTEP